MLQIRDRHDSENILKFLNENPEFKDKIEAKFQNHKNWIETDVNFWQSHKITKKAFYVYFGIGFPKADLKEIAKSLKITEELARQKVDTVVRFIRDEAKGK